MTQNNVVLALPDVNKKEYKFLPSTTPKEHGSIYNYFGSIYNYLQTNTLYNKLVTQSETVDEILQYISSPAKEPMKSQVTNENIYLHNEEPCINECHLPVMCFSIAMYPDNHITKAYQLVSELAHKHMVKAENIHIAISSDIHSALKTHEYKFYEANVSTWLTRVMLGYSIMLIFEPFFFHKKMTPTDTHQHIIILDDDYAIDISDELKKSVSQIIYLDNSNRNRIKSSNCEKMIEELQQLKLIHNWEDWKVQYIRLTLRFCTQFDVAEPILPVLSNWLLTNDKSHQDMLNINIII